MANDNLNTLIETKLTKGEAIDLLIEEMRVESEKREKVLELRIEKLQDSFTAADLNISDKVRFHVVPSYSDHSRLEVRIVGSLSQASLGPTAQAKLNELREIREEYEQLRKQNYKFETKGNANRFKQVILKTMLEGTEEGQRFLELIGNLKLKVQPKLLGSGE